MFFSSEIWNQTYYICRHRDLTLYRSNSPGNTKNG